MRRMIVAAVLATAAGCEPAGQTQEAASRIEDDASGQHQVTRAFSLPPHRVVTYSFDPRPECSAAPEIREGAAAGLAMWADFGVQVIEADDLPTDAATRRDVVSVCFAAGPFWGSRLGSTSWTAHGVQMTVRTDVFTDWIDSIVAHELGHVILESAEHLDDSRCGFVDAPDPCGGIMGGRYVWPEFTDLDVAFMNERGLRWDPRALGGQ
jgi:hypothetical protein